MGNEKSLNKPYLIGVLCLTLIFPALCILIEIGLNKNQSFSLSLVGKWFIFWCVGIRLLTAGLRQVINPSFTAKTIFHIENQESFVIVKELGFANICFGLVGIASLFFPTWRIVSAFGSGIFFGIAGFNHLFRKQASANELIALLSDIFIFLCLAAYTVFNFIGANQ
jgi:hypothetical protein